MGQTQQGIELFRIYLLPEFFGQGIGGLLLAKGEQYLSQQGLSSYFCFVHSANELGKRFYKKQGFHHVSERDENDEWFMEKQLSEPDMNIKRNTPRNTSVRSCSLSRSAVPTVLYNAKGETRNLARPSGAISTNIRTSLAPSSLLPGLAH